MKRYIWNDTDRKCCHLILKLVSQVLMADTESDPESVPQVHNKKVTEAKTDTICEDSAWWQRLWD